MQVIKIHTKLTQEEKEVNLLYDVLRKQWTMDTTAMKFYNKAKKQGWTQIVKYVYDDGTVCGGVFEAPDYSITVRSVVKKQMSEKQMENLRMADDE